MSLRNLVHCALCAAHDVRRPGGVLPQLGAQFVGLAQILVYVGAVAILIVFAILVTRGSGARRVHRFPWFSVVGVAVLVAGTLVSVVTGQCLRAARRCEWAPGPGATVQAIGEKLMTHYVLPLEAIGLLLTAALVGAVLACATRNRSKRTAEAEPAHRMMPLQCYLILVRAPVQRSGWRAR